MNCDVKLFYIVMYNLFSLLILCITTQTYKIDMFTKVIFKDYYNIGMKYLSVIILCQNM